MKCLEVHIVILGLTMCCSNPHSPFYSKKNREQVKIRIFFFLFLVENVHVYLGVLDIDICGVWHLAANLRSVAVLDGKFICGFFLASKHKKSTAGLEKIGKQQKTRMPIKSKRTSLERNSFLCIACLGLLLSLFSVRLEMLCKVLNGRLGLYIRL